MVYLLNLLLGYIQITVESAYTERFLNLLSLKNISFWGLEILEYGKIRLYLHAGNFKQLRPIAQKTASKIRITRKCGLPFFIHKFKGRIALFSGIIIFCTVIWALTSFVWIIDISGGDPELQHEVLKQLSFNGLKPGAYSYGINHDEMKNDILITFPELANITVNISGSRALVNLYMKTPAPEITDYSTPSNIISDYDGIITSITVTSGVPEVSPGDIVRRGQLLAGSYMTGRTGVTVEYRAIADIRAKTLEHFKIALPKSTFKKNYTGNSKKKSTLIFGKNRINLHFGTGNPYATCDKIVEKVQVILPFGLKIPLYLETCTFNEYIFEPYEISLFKAEEFLSQNADKYIDLKENDRILNREFSCGVEDNKLLLNFTAECERKIGVEQMIPKGE